VSAHQQTEPFSRNARPNPHHRRHLRPENPFIPEAVSDAG